MSLVAQFNFQMKRRKPLKDLPEEIGW